MSDLLTKYLLHADPIHRGWTRAGVAHGRTLTGGLFARYGGGTVLYRGASASTATEPIGAAGPGATTIRPWAWRHQASGTTYYFRCEAVGSGGVAAVDPATDPPITRVRTGDDGTANAATPPAPRRLTVSPVAGGKFVVQWEYRPVGGLRAASEWRIYSDEGTGTVDYVTALDTVSARVSQSGAGLYQWLSDAYADTTEVQFVVRARTAAGEEEQNANAVSAEAAATGPTGAAVVEAELGADE